MSGPCPRCSRSPPLRMSTPGYARALPALRPSTGLTLSSNRYPSPGNSSRMSPKIFDLPGEFMRSAMPFIAAAAMSLSGTAALAADAQQLLKEKGCLACHTLDKKLVGPAYKDVAAKYKPRKDAEA